MPDTVQDCKAWTEDTPEHALIVSNIIGLLHERLKGTPCKPFGSGLGVTAGGKVVHPDVAVLCPPVQCDSRRPEAVRNPRVVFEVRSPATEAYDWSEKFALYRQCEGFLEYVQLSSDRVRGETYSRNANDTLAVRFLGPDDTVRLMSIDCDIPLSAFYEGMEMLVK